MLRLKRIVQKAFDEEEDQTHSDDNSIFKRKAAKKLFPHHDSLPWKTLRCFLSLLFFSSHVVVGIIFLTFFITTLAFNITIALSMVGEIINHSSTTSIKKDLLSVCLFVLLFAMMIISCFILSLFGEILKVFLFKTSLKYNLTRTMFISVAMVVCCLWLVFDRTHVDQISLAEFLELLALVCWIYAFVFSVLGSLLLVVFVFTESATGSYCHLLLHVVIVLVLIAFSVINPVAFGIVVSGVSGEKISFVLFFPLFTAILVIYTYFRGFKQHSNTNIFNKYISLLYILLFVFTLVLSMLTNTPGNCNSASCGNQTTKSSTIKEKATHSLADGYPICSNRWTSVDLDIADMAFITSLTYNQAVGTNNSLLQAEVNQYFKEQNIAWSIENTNIKKSSLCYFHIRHKNVNVLGIGSPTVTKEYTKAALLWNEIATLQTLSLVVPVLNYFPVNFIAEYVSKSAYISQIIQNSDQDMHIYQEIDNILKNINRTSDEVILVGHSFGGGIANIIGARMEIPAVSFSSPGVKYGYLKFGFSLEDASRYLVSITTRKDLVSLIDKHSGLNQMISCDGKTFAECHTIEHTYCELRAACGLGKYSCKEMINSRKM